MLSLLTIAFALRPLHIETPASSIAVHVLSAIDGDAIRNLGSIFTPERLSPSWRQSSPLSANTGHRTTTRKHPMRTSDPILGAAVHFVRMSSRLDRLANDGSRVSM